MTKQKYKYIKIIYSPRLTREQRLHNSWIYSYTFEGLGTITKPTVVYRVGRSRTKILKIKPGQRFKLG